MNKHIKSVIESANMTWNQAFNSGNYKEVAALYAEKGILSPGNGNKLVGRSEIENLFKSFVDGGVHDHALEIIDVGGSDKLIYQVSRWSASGAETDEKKVEFGGITTSVLEQVSDEKWQILSHVWNVNQ